MKREREREREKVPRVRAATAQLYVIICTGASRTFVQQHYHKRDNIYITKRFSAPVLTAVRVHPPRGYIGEADIVVWHLREK